MRDRFGFTKLDKLGLKQTRQPGTEQSSESAERGRAFAARAAAIEKLKRLRTKTP